MKNLPWATVWINTIRTGLVGEWGSEGWIGWDGWVEGGRGGRGNHRSHYRVTPGGFPSTETLILIVLRP